MKLQLSKLVLLSLIMISIACNKEKTVLNSENLLNATAWFQQSAEMRACYIQSFNQAKEQLLVNLQKTKSELPKAIIVDIDETMLDNSPYEVYLIQNNLIHKKELWNQWVQMAIAEPLPGALDFAKFAEQNKVDVFYVSNRSVNNLKPTKKNLLEKGFPFANDEHILLKDTTSDKSPRREFIASKYDIILFVGDNLRDFDEIFKDRSDNFGFKTVDNNDKLFGSKFIILPNPMYGQWMKIYNVPNADISNSEKIENMKKMMKAY